MGNWPDLCAPREKLTKKRLVWNFARIKLQCHIRSSYQISHSNFSQAKRAQSWRNTDYIRATGEPCKSAALVLFLAEQPQQCKGWRWGCWVLVVGFLYFFTSPAAISHNSVGMTQECITPTSTLSHTRSTRLERELSSSRGRGEGRQTSFLQPKASGKGESKKKTPQQQTIHLCAPSREFKAKDRLVCMLWDPLHIKNIQR